MNSNLISKINPNQNDYFEFGHASNYDRNFRKTKVYIRFLIQSDEFTDENLSMARANLTTLCYCLGDCLLSDIYLKGLDFLTFRKQMNINDYEKSQLISNIQTFLLWAKSIYPYEFVAVPLSWICNITI